MSVSLKIIILRHSLCPSPNPLSHTFKQGTFCLPFEPTSTNIIVRLLLDKWNCQCKCSPSDLKIPEDIPFHNEVTVILDIDSSTPVPKLRPN